MMGIERFVSLFGRTREIEMVSKEYTPSEIWLFALALVLGFFLLMVGETPDAAALPAFLAWLMVNRRK